MSNYRENKIFITVQSGIIRFIDFFYPIFERFMPKNTYRYLFSGGSGFILDVLVYWVSFNLILQKQDVFITDSLVISAAIFAYIISFCIVTPYSFCMSKFIVFQSSNLKGRIQLFRYFVIVGINILLNLILMKIMMDWLHIYPTISRILTAILVAVFSFFSQQYFTFGSSQKSSKIKQTN